jgi:LDH2 family malate/lactate/ureidoglycolate dehydrogenase
MSHSGALSYYTEQAAAAGLVALSLCQSDPMVGPFGAAEPYYGTNPVAFAALGVRVEMLSFDMATTVQAWRKILQARSEGDDIPDDWAVDRSGRATVARATSRRCCLWRGRRRVRPGDDGGRACRRLAGVAVRRRRLVDV